MKGIACVIAVCMLIAGCSQHQQPEIVYSNDPQLNLLLKLAQAQFSRGNVERAEQLFQRAMTRAEEIDDSAVAANASYNVAVSLMALGDYDRASTTLFAARLTFERMGKVPADVDLLQAKLDRLMGKPDKAWAITDKLLAMPPAERSDDLTLLAYVLRAELLLDRNQPAEARAQAALAGNCLSAGTETVVRAGLVHVRGRLLLIEGKAREAAAEFDAEQKLLRECQSYWRVPECLLQSGRALLAAGDTGLAARRMLRAGQMWLASANGDPSEAGMMALREALAAAKTAKDADLQAYIEDVIQAAPTSQPAD